MREMEIVNGDLKRELSRATAISDQFRDQLRDNVVCDMTFFFTRHDSFIYIYIFYVYIFYVYIFHVYIFYVYIFYVDVYDP